MGWLNTSRFLMTHPLGRRAKGQALRRFFQWQVASRLSPGPIAMPFVGGARLLVQRSMTGATGNVYVGLHEFADMAFLLHALRAEDTFLDVGANIGSYTVLAGKVIGAHCIAVEPIASTIAHLRDNLVLNAIADRTRLEGCAVGEAPGVVRMTASEDTVNHVVRGEAGPHDFVEVPVRTLDDVVGDGPAPRLMKMDIEGYELPALRGATQLLANQDLRACIVEVSARGQDVLALMTGFQFEPAIYDGFSRTLTPAPGLNQAGNTLFVRDPDWLTARLRAAPAFVALGQRV